MVWPCLKVFWFSKDNPTGHSERKKKKRQTEEEVGRQYQRVDRNGLCVQLGQLKTGQDGKGLLQIHLWCPDNLPRLWDRIEKNRIKQAPVLSKHGLLSLIQVGLTYNSALLSLSNTTGCFDKAFKSCP